MKRNNIEAIEIGKRHDQSEPSQPSGSERARDEQRVSGGPRYGGEDWKVADDRGAARFGKARNDDAEPSEVVRAGEDPDAEVEPGHDENLADEMNAATTGEMPRPTIAADDSEVIESGGEMAGMGRGEKPRKPKASSKR